MRKFIKATASATIFALLMPAHALAQSYPPSPGPTTVVQSGSGGGAAFTGSDVTPVVIAIGVLVLIGLVAVVWARKGHALDRSV